MYHGSMLLAMDKQELVSELDHYLMIKMRHAAAEDLELPCSQEYCSEIEGYKATAFHRLRPEKERTYQQKTFKLRDLASLLLCLQGIQIDFLKPNASEIT